jgi:hypothetical protein
MDDSFKCRSCGAETSLTKREHICNGYLTVYRPNTGKRTKQSNPDYRKRFCSRARRPVIQAGFVLN